MAIATFLLGRRAGRRKIRLGSITCASIRISSFAMRPSFVRCTCVKSRTRRKELAYGDWLWRRTPRTPHRGTGRRGSPHPGTPRRDPRTGSPTARRPQIRMTRRRRNARPWPDGRVLRAAHASAGLWPRPRRTRYAARHRQFLAGTTFCTPCTPVSSDAVRLGPLFAGQRATGVWGRVRPVGRPETVAGSG